MTDIEAKALALVNEVSDERAIPRWTTFYRKENGFVEALCRAIEQHEAFKQEVSDAVEAYLNPNNRIYSHSLNRFIIPKPKPDPLEQVIAECDDGTWETIPEYANKFRAALDALGFEIRSKNDGQ